MGITKKMGKHRKTRHKKYVDHPRFGNIPIYSGSKLSAEDIINSYWRYRGETIFPETAIKADASKQNFSMSPISIYVDIEKQWP